MGPNQFAANVNMIVRKRDGMMIPVSDTRKGGVGAGY